MLELCSIRILIKIMWTKLIICFKAEIKFIEVTIEVQSSQVLLLIDDMLLLDLSVSSYLVLRAGTMLLL